jgi:hypothetical protein
VNDADSRYVHGKLGLLVPCADLAAFTPLHTLRVVQLVISSTVDITRVMTAMTRLHTLTLHYVEIVTPDLGCLTAAESLTDYSHSPCAMGSRSRISRNSPRALVCRISRSPCCRCTALVASGFHPLTPSQVTSLTPPTARLPIIFSTESEVTNIRSGS